MDRVRRERRIGFISVAGALLVVGSFWTVGYPLFHRYKIHKREAELRKALETLKLPAGGRLFNIFISNDKIFGACLVRGTAIYSADSSTVQIKAHYEGEFSTHGFAQNTANPVKDADILGRFENSQYDATIKVVNLKDLQDPKNHGLGTIYVISVSAKDISC